MADDDPPLAGCVVVDASTHLAGPFAGMMLADLGATVVKVEPPSGDPLRRYVGPRRTVGQLSASVNRNKRSVALDLKAEADRATFLEMLAGADVLLHNWRPTTEDSLRLGDDVVVGVNPRLVRLAITGFGPTGPRAEEPAFDHIIQAMTGLATRQGAPGEPQPVRTYIADKTTSMFAVQAVLAALVRRGVTGTGVRVDLPMLDATAYANFPDLYEGALYRDNLGDAEPPRELRAFARTADGFMVIAPGSGQQLKRTLEVAGHPELKEQLIGAGDRNEMFSRLLNVLDPVFSASPTGYWLDQFRAAGIPCGAVVDVEEHLHEPQIVHNGTYDIYHHPEHGAVLAARYPARFRGLHSVPLSPFPAVGGT